MAEQHLFQTWNDWSDTTRMTDWFASKAEIERLRAAISGWRDHYGWKDGEYVDNVNDVFGPLLRGAYKTDVSRSAQTAAAPDNMCEMAARLAGVCKDDGEG